MFRSPQIIDMSDTFTFYFVVGIHLDVSLFFFIFIYSHFTNIHLEKNMLRQLDQSFIYCNQVICLNQNSGGFVFLIFIHLRMILSFSSPWLIQFENFYSDFIWKTPSALLIIGRTVIFMFPYLLINSFIMSKYLAV